PPGPGSRCCWGLSLGSARSARKSSIATRRYSAAAGPVARCARSSSITAVWLAAKSHSSKPGHACARAAVLPKGARLHLRRRQRFRWLSGRDSPLTIEPGGSPPWLAYLLFRLSPVPSGAADSSLQWILHGEFHHQRLLHLVADKSDDSVDTHGADSLP